MSADTLDDVTVTPSANSGLLMPITTMVFAGVWVLGFIMAVPAMHETSRWENLFAGATAMGWVTIPAFLWVLHSLDLPRKVTLGAGVALALLGLAHPMVAGATSIGFTPLIWETALGVLAAACILVLANGYARK